MGLQALQNNYFGSEFGKSFASSKKEQVNKKVNNNNNNAIVKQKNNLTEPIQLFKKIANADRKALSSSSKIVNNKASLKSGNVIIISGVFLNSVYEGFQWNSIKGKKRAWNRDVSLASIFSQQHLPEVFKKQNIITKFPNSDICFGKSRPKPFHVKIEREKKRRE